MVDLICIIDTSAILYEPEWREYYSAFGPGGDTNIKKLFVFIPDVLLEIDTVKHTKAVTSPTKDNADIFSTSFMQRYKEKKLSEGFDLDNGDILYFFPENMKRIHDKRLFWLSNSGADKSLVSLALVLKERFAKNVLICTGDIMIEIACMEFGINFIFVGKNVNYSKTASNLSEAGHSPLDSAPQDANQLVS
ncbi:MAG: PIN domain-containing protein [Patescibacteria group bacterium]